MEQRDAPSFAIAPRQCSHWQQGQRDAPMFATEQISAWTDEEIVSQKEQRGALRFATISHPVQKEHRDAPRFATISHPVQKEHRDAPRFATIESSETVVAHAKLST
jgi:hypothetical protein